MWMDDILFRDPWQDMNRLQSELNRLFTGVRDRTGNLFPAVNVWTSHEGAVVQAELAGVSQDKLDVSVLGETLTLKGQREPLDLKEDEKLYRRERGYGEFSRSVQLPFKVEANKVHAEFKNGILQLMLPRAEVDKPRRIEIKAS